jgi:hypothetical protein
MGNELQTTGNKELANRSQIDNRVRNLEDGGYYKNVVSPEEYLSERKESGDSELELSDEDGNVSSSELSTPQKVEPLKHWNLSIQRKFDSCSESQKKAWLDSFAIIEKGYAKQLAMQKKHWIDDLVAPFEKDLKKLDLTSSEYIAELIKLDNDLGSKPAETIASLMLHRNINFNQIDAVLDKVAIEMDQQAVIAPLQKDMNRIKSSLGIQSPEGTQFPGTQSPDLEYAQNQEAEQVANKISEFYNQTDKTGKQLYPGAIDNIEAILAQVEQGNTLDKAYYIVMNNKESPASKEEEQQVDYEETESPKKKRKLNALEEEKQMLRNTLNKLRG